MNISKEVREESLRKWMEEQDRLYDLQALREQAEIDYFNKILTQG